MKTRTGILVAAAAGIVAVAAGQANADFKLMGFEDLAPGSAVSGFDGWAAWNDVAAHAGVITSDVAYDGVNSLRIAGYTDAVRAFSGVTSGQISLSAKQYIPSGQSGLTYFILMNDYIPGGNTNAGQWSTQLRFDLGSGFVRDDFRGGSVPIVFDSWSDIRVDIDLDANTVAQFYNDTLIAKGSWTRNSRSMLQLSALDLYSGDKNVAYYDGVSLSGDVPAPSTTGALAILAAGLALPLRRRMR